MSEQREPFRLQDDDEGSAPKAGPGSVPRPARHPAEGNGRPLPPSGDRRVGRPSRTRPPAADAEVDPRTVAERQGKGVEQVAGRRPVPLGWPREAFSFPLRPPGPAQIAGGAAVLVGLDLVTWANLFLGLVLQLFALVFFLRWQLYVASMSAGGRDASMPWIVALDVQAEHLKPLAGWLLRAVLVVGVAAGLLTWVSLLSGLVAALAGAVWLSARALALVVSDPTVGRLDGLLAWFSRRPLALLSVGVGWAVAGSATWAEAQLAPSSLVLALLLFVPLRVLTLYAWLLGARILGVLGRDWSPYVEGQTDSAPPSGEAGED